MNVAHEDGSMTLDNASVQRLMDYDLLHFGNDGWYIGRFGELWDSDSDAARSAETEGLGSPTGPASAGAKHIAKSSPCNPKVE